MTENKLKINEYTFNDQFYNYLIEYSREADYKWGETEFVLQTGYLAGTPVKPSAMIHEIDPSSCLLYTSPSPRDGLLSRMPSSA